MMIRNRNVKLSSFILILFLIVSFAVSVGFWLAGKPGVRRIFIFPQTHGNRYIVESRRLPLFPAQGKYENYVDELLLGPLSEQTSPIFYGGTRIISCFERENILYVNISSDFIYDDAQSADFRGGVNLFKKNIAVNFPHLKRVELFVDGKIPFDGLM